jgi:hypothetical protein
LITFTLPLLNQTEQVTFSFLLNSEISKDNINIELRGRGIQGTKYSTNDLSEEPFKKTLFISTLGLLVLIIGLVIFIVVHQRRVLRYQLLSFKLENEKQEVIIKELKQSITNQHGKNDEQKDL